MALKSNKLPTRHHLVVVSWRDAHTSLDQDLEGDYILHTVGWLRKKGKRWTYLSNEATPSRWRGQTRIPSSEVVDIQRLAVRRSRKKGGS